MAHRKNVFSIQRRIQLFHTDAAGILFYSKAFELAFEAFDALLSSLGVSVAHIIAESDFLLPYVHAEADYLLPLTVGQQVTINVTVENLGDSSCTLRYDFFTPDNEKALTAKTVQVAVNKKTGQKMSLPRPLRDGLERYAKGNDVNL